MTQATATPARNPKRNKRKYEPRKGSATSIVRELIRTNPNMKAKTIAKIVGCKPHTVHNVRYMLKLSTPTAENKEVVGTVGQSVPMSKEQPKDYDQAQAIITQNLHIELMRLAINDVVLMLVESGRTDLLSTTQFRNLVKCMHRSETPKL